MFCIQCGGKIEDGAKFCGKCGRAVPAAAQSAPLEKRCAVCGTVLKDGMKFCPKCGGTVPARQDTVSEPLATENSAGTGVEPAGMAGSGVQTLVKKVVKIIRKRAVRIVVGAAVIIGVALLAVVGIRTGRYFAAKTAMEQNKRALLDQGKRALDQGKSALDKGDYDLAIANYTEAIRIDPANPEAYNGRGSAYNGKKDYERATVDFNVAIRTI